MLKVNGGAGFKHKQSLFIGKFLVYLVLLWELVYIWKMERVKNVFATGMLFILYALYRVGMLPWITDTVMTFPYWNMHAQVTDFVKSLFTWLFVVSVLVIGIWWTLIALVGLFLLNWAVFLLWQRFKGRRNG